MNRKLKSFSLMAIALIALSAEAVCGDVILEIDMDMEADGIQSTRSATVDELFDVGVLMRITGSNTVPIFSFGLDFDNAELSVLSVDTTGRPLGFGQVNVATFNNATGVVRPFEALNFGGALDNTFSGLVAILQVRAVAPITDGFADITPAYQNLAIDGVIDGTTFGLVPDGVTPGDGGLFINSGTLNITAVPEPSALCLCAIAAGLWHRKRRKINFPQR
jgi:hypothetical protein